MLQPSASLHEDWGEKSAAKGRHGRLLREVCSSTSAISFNVVKRILDIGLVSYK